MGNITNEERERRHEAEENMRNLGIAIAVIALLTPIIIKLIKWAIQIIIALIVFPFQKPKIALPLYGIVACICGGMYYWYNTPEQKFIRAKNNTNIVERMKTLEEIVDKDYLPAIIYYAELCDTKGDHSKSYSLYSKAATLGDVNALYKKAVYLEKGIGVERNFTEAHECYTKAASLGHSYAQKDQQRIANIAKYWNAAHQGEAEAQYMLAICYATGNGIEKDESIARKWFKSSADGGFAKAQLAFGVWLLKGKGGEKDIPQGMEYCEKAAKQNYSEAFGILGSLYFEGVVVARNYKKAVEHYTKAAQIGSISAIFNLAFCYREGFGVKKNLAEAFKLFTAASEKGFIPAAFCVAECYENGNGVEINYTHALNFYTKAASQKWENATIKKSNADAENGKRRLARIGKYWQAAVENDANAQYQVAVCYLDADGVKKDVKKAFNWFSAAAKQNNIDAIVMIADYQLNGVIVEKNTKAAFGTFLKGAELGSATAISRVGWCYEAGLGVEQNYTRAYNWYMKLERKYPGNGIKDAEKIKQVAAVWDDAIKNKKPEAQFLLGSYYAEGVSGLSKDLKKSFSLYQRAADQGHPEAMFRLAQCYVNGIGTKKDLKVALDWYRKAAEKNHGNALFELGGYYLTGNMVEQNLTTAYDCYEKAVQAGFKQATEAKNKIATVAKYWQKAHAGDAESQYMLAKCYAEGVSGVTADETKAFTWYKKAADQGHSEAMFQIVRCYAKGIGVGKDEKIALDWCRKAAEKNHGNALFELGQLYRDGLLVEQNLTTAYQYFEKSENVGFMRATAEKNKISIIAKYWQKAYDGDAESQYQLARCYVEGTGIAKNTDIAKQWFQKAVDQKHPGAQYDLAVSYIASGKTEQFVPAFELLAQAASNNHTKAIVKLAECYYNGIGVKEDYEKAVELWEKTAKLNDPDAMYFLGVFRSTGRGFFNSGKDFKEALKLWEKSSELGNKDASYKLAIYYKVEKKNFNRSLLYYARASKQGHLQAMYFYGEYQYKQGMQEDGLELIKRAAELGNADAVKFLKNLPIQEKSTPQLPQPPVTNVSAPTQKKELPAPPNSISEQSVNISGTNIAIKQKAKALEERDAVAAMERLLSKWTPEKFVTTSFLPIEGKKGEFISTQKVGNKVKITTYVLLGIDQKKFFSELVPEVSMTLNSIAIHQVMVSRDSESTWKGGFWWGEYNKRSIQRSPFKLQAKYFLLDDFVKKARRYRNEIYLNTSYDNFTVYELPSQVDVDRIRHNLHSKSFTVNINFLDKDKNIVKTFSRVITEKGEYGEVFNYPMYSYYRTGTQGTIPLMISPEFCGHHTYEGSHDCAFVYFPQMVKKIEGYVTDNELENIVSMSITCEVN